MEMEVIMGSHHKYADSVPSRTRTSSIILYGEVNSVKNHNYKLWLNDGVY